MSIISIDVGTVNMGICIMDTKETIKYWDVINIKAKSAKDTCKNLFLCLDKIKELEEVTRVLIEKQPTMNPRSRVVEGYIISYFVMKNIDFKLNRSITTYSPKYKLRCYKGKVPKFKVKSAYTIRKKTAIFHTREMIKGVQDQYFVDFFESCKKKDDASDAYLMCIAYIRFVLNKFKPIEEEPESDSDDDGVFLIE